MLLVSKLYAESRDFDFQEVPFVGKYYQNYGDSHYKAVLVDTITMETQTISVKNFTSLIDRLQELRPYGYDASDIGNGTLFHRVMSVSKQAYKFLDYIDSVELVKKEECGVDLSGLHFGEGLSLYRVLDKYATLFGAYIITDPDDVFEDFYDIAVTLFDAVCLAHKVFINGSFYIQTSILQNECDSYSDADFSYVCKVTCSDIVKANSLVARSSVMRPELINTMKLWGRV